MKNNPYIKKTSLSALCLGFAFYGTQLVQADLFNGDGDGTSWEDPDNWLLDAVPLNNGSGNTFINVGDVVFDNDTWTALDTASNLQSATQYRVQRFLLNESTSAPIGIGSITFDFDSGGAGRSVLQTNSNSSIWGSRTGTTTANFVSGTVNSGSNTTLGARDGTGIFNITGGSFVVGRASLNLGNGTTGTGVLNISSGSLTTRAGVNIRGISTFHVDGSGASQIGIGSEGSLDGFWSQEAGGTLRVSVDGGGVTPIFVDDVGGGATATFDSGALLDVGFVDTAVSGTWTVLELEGAAIDNGVGNNNLAFAPGVDTGVWSFAIDNSGANGLLTVTAVAPSFVWNGNIDDNWDLVTANWQGGVTFSEPIEAFFDDTLAGSGTVNLVNDFIESIIVVDNDTEAYTFTGSGKISGISSLKKNGPGQLTLNNTNDFTGPFQVNDGTLTLGNVSAFGPSGSPFDMNGGTLDLSGLSVTKSNIDIAGGAINNGTITSPITGGAGTINADLVGAATTVTKTGSGTLLLAGANTYDGVTTVSGGTLQLGSDSALGTSSISTIPITVENDKVVDALMGNEFLLLGDTSGLLVGDLATSTGIPAGAVIVSIATDVNVELDMNATVTNVALDVTFSREESVEVTLGDTQIASGATLDLNGSTTGEILSITGGTGVDGLGQLINSDTFSPAVITTDIVNPQFFTVGGAGDLTLPNYSRIPGNVQRRLTKVGAGTLTLAGDISNNRFGLTVDEGDVILAKTDGEAVSRFPLIINNPASTVTLTVSSEQINDATDVNGRHQINEGTLDLNGFDESLAALVISAGAGGTITNSDVGTTSTFTLLSADADATWPGTISGNLDLVKEGTLCQVLSGTNTYSGTTTINGGAIVIGQAAGIPANGVGVTVAALAGFGFDPSGLTDGEMDTIISNVSWDVASGLVFKVYSPDTELVSIDLSGFPGGAITLVGDGTLDLSASTLPEGILLQTPDGGTILDGSAPVEIVVDGVTVEAGSVSGSKVTLAFTATGNVDAYASDSLEGGTWTLVASDIASSPAVVEDNVASTERFYVLVPAGNGNPYP